MNRRNGSEVSSFLCMSACGVGGDGGRLSLNFSEGKGGGVA